MRKVCIYLLISISICLSQDCESIEYDYDQLHSGVYSECEFNIDCVAVWGDCDVGLGGCHYGVNAENYPGGHIDEKDCTIEHGAVRELKEETNLNCEVCDLVYLGQPKPEKFYFYAKSWDGSVDVGIPNPETDEIEHDDYKWATIDDIKDLANTEIPIYLLEKALEMSKNAK